MKIFSDTELLIPPSEFESLNYNIRNIPQGVTVLDAFPDLHSMDEFHAELPKNIDRNIAMQFMILMYDPKCFLKHKYPEWKKRKMAAAILAGWKEYNPQTGLFPEHVDRIMKCQVQNFNIMVIRFCRIFNNHLYSLMVTSHDIFYYGLETVINFEIQNAKGKSDIDTERARNALLAQYETTQIKLDEHAKKLFNDEKDISFGNLKQDLFCMIDKEALLQRKVSVERQAQATELALKTVE